MTNWQIYQLLVFILGEKNLESHIETLNSSGLWPKLLKLSSHEMVTTQIGIILKNNPIVWQKIPSDEATYLDEIVALNAERNQQIVEQTNEIIHSLNSKGITPLIMKGTSLLLNSAENRLGYRMQLDIDLLVHPKDLDQSICHIKKLGYQYAKESKNGLEVVPDEFAKNLLNAYKGHKHLPPLLKPNTRASVELHRHPYSQRYRKHYDSNGIFDRAELVKKDGLIWYRMSVDDERQLLLTGGYIDPRLMASFILPSRLVRDYLDLKKRIDDTVDGDQKNLTHQYQPPQFAKAQNFAEKLILTMSENHTKKVETETDIKKYLKKLEHLHANPKKHRFVHNRATFVRRLINFSHNPRLLLKRLH